MIIAVTGYRPKDLFGYQTEQPYWTLQHRIEEAITDIARWNRLPIDAIELRTGGTAATMRMAKLKSIPIHRINPVNDERE